MKIIGNILFFGFIALHFIVVSVFIVIPTKIISYLIRPLLKGVKNA